MIIGAHALIYSNAPEEARKLLAKILGSRTVDAGGGWTIMALPPAEIAVHPSNGVPTQELFLMCDNLERTMEELRGTGVAFSQPVQEASWGSFTTIALPGGGSLGLYQPRHPTAIAKAKKSAKGTKRSRSKDGRGRSTRGPRAR